MNGRGTPAAHRLSDPVCSAHLVNSLKRFLGFSTGSLCACHGPVGPLVGIVDATVECINPLTLAVDGGLGAVSTLCGIGELDERMIGELVGNGYTPVQRHPRAPVRPKPSPHERLRRRAVSKAAA